MHIYTFILSNESQPPQPIVVFTPDVLMLFWPSRDNFEGIVLKYCTYSQFSSSYTEASNFKTVD